LWKKLRKASRRKKKKKSSTHEKNTKPKKSNKRNMNQRDQAGRRRIRISRPKKFDLQEKCKKDLSLNHRGTPEH
jgi:hypothetical protein